MTLNFSTTLSKIKLQSLKGLSKEDLNTYSQMCIDYSTEYNLAKDFDFFDHALTIPMTKDGWRDYLLSVRSLGRFSATQLKGESKSENIKTMLKAKFAMEHISTPLIKISQYALIARYTLSNFKKMNDQMWIEIHRQEAAEQQVEKQCANTQVLRSHTI